jgi:hypothetical protein
MSSQTILSQEHFATKPQARSEQITAIRPASPPQFQGAPVFFGAADFDESLKNCRRDAISLMTVPADVTVKYWADSDTGFFLYFSNDERPHAVSDNVHKLSVNGQPPIDLDQKRLKVSQMLMIGELQKIQDGSAPGVPMPDNLKEFGFASLGHDGSEANMLAYVARLTRIERADLLFQKHLLQPLMLVDNPYGRLQMADIDSALAIKPIIDQLFAGTEVAVDKAIVFNELNRAIALYQEGNDTALRSLTLLQTFTPSNTTMPLAPFDTNPRGPSGYSFNFWGGAADQIKARIDGLRLVSNLIARQGLPKFNFEQTFRRHALLG